MEKLKSLDSLSESVLRKNGRHFGNINKLRTDAYNVVSKLSVRYVRAAEPIAYTEQLKLRPITRGRSWGRAFSCGIFKVSATLPQDYDKRDLRLLIDLGGEGLVHDLNDSQKSVVALTNKMNYSDGLEIYAGKAFVAIDKLKVVGGAVNIYIDAGYNGFCFGAPYGVSMYKTAKLVEVDEAIRKYCLDYIVLAYKMLVVEGQRKYLDELLTRSYKLYRQGKLIEAQSLLTAELSLPSQEKSHFTAIGHSHLDLAWLWPLRETKRKAFRTFYNQISNIKRYKDYVYGISQPQQLQWIKDNDKDLFEDIKKYVASGQIELQGGMWVEADTNLTSGESLIRQIMYGKRFFADNFANEQKMCWLPDVFGYNANLPQILKGCGLDYFMTIKLSWNEYNRFKYNTFYWQGLNDSKVLAHLAPEGDYNSSATPRAIRFADRCNQSKSVSDEALLIFGTGDGGGGPSPIHIELLERERDLKDVPKVRFGKAIDFFNRLSDGKDIPTHVGELYLEKHQGTYTSQALIKKNNRQTENNLHDTEFINTLSYIGGAEYPSDKIEQIAKEMALYQFHDILPGSSIHRVYKEANARYEILNSQLDELKNTAFNSLGSSDGLSVVNCSPFARDEYIKNNGQWYKVDVKAYQMSYLRPFVDDNSCLAFGKDFIENDKLRISFDKKGVIVSMLDKNNGKQYADKGGLNKLVLYYDKFTQYNAWDIDPSYLTKKGRQLRLASRKFSIDGCQVVCVNNFVSGRTRVTQRVSLNINQQFVNISTTATWRKTFKMLRANFYPTVYSDSVKCDIQMGNYDRSALNDTREHQAQYEICAHKYVAVSDNESSFAVINDCKYGHRVKEGLISLNLLRSPIYPDFTADKGEHTFNYAIYAYDGGVFDGDLIKNAYNYQRQPIVVNKDMTSEFKFEFDEDNIVVETIKKADLSDGIIVRCYETYGKVTNANLLTSLDVDRAYNATLDEVVGSKLERGWIKFAPFEIKTFFFEK